MDRPIFSDLRRGRGHGNAEEVGKGLFGFCCCRPRSDLPGACLGWAAKRVTGVAAALALPVASSGAARALADWLAHAGLVGGLYS